MGLREFSSRVAWCLPIGLFLLGAPACDRKPESGTRAATTASSPAPAVSAPRPPASAASPAAAPSESPSATRSPLDHLFQGKCPSYVRGAQTRIEDTKGGMHVTISADDSAHVAEIRSRSHYLAAGKSGGGDGTGRCPVPRDGKLTIVETERGVEIDVLPPKGTTIKDMRQRARDMLDRIPKN